MIKCDHNVIQRLINGDFSGSPASALCARPVRSLPASQAYRCGLGEKNEDFCTENDDFCIKNEKLCIKNDDFCTENEELCIKNDDFCTENEEFCIRNDEFCTENEEFCIRNDEFCRWCQPGDNLPDTMSATGTPSIRDSEESAATNGYSEVAQGFDDEHKILPWFENMWLSNRDMLQCVERCIDYEPDKYAEFRNIETLMYISKC